MDMIKKSFYILLAIFIWAPLPWGANSLWASMMLATLIFLLGFTATWFGSRRGGSVSKLYLSLWVSWFIWLGLVSFQLLPIPASLLEFLSPASVELRCHLLGESVCNSPQRLTLYYDGTLRAVVFTAALMTLYFSVIELVNSRRAIIVLLYTVLVSAIFQAAYGTFMTLSGLEYGFFEVKGYGHNVATGTFVNRNHLAGYLEMCAGLSMGLLVYHFKFQGGSSPWRENVQRFLGALLSEKMLVRLGLVVIVIGVIMTRSRTGNTALFSSIILGGCAWVFLSGKATKVTIALFVSLILVDVYLVGEWFGFDRVVERLAGTDLDKEQRVPVSIYVWEMIKDYPLTGVGLGAFGSVFSSYLQSDVGNMFLYAHNDYLQFIAEAGVIACLPLAFIGLSAFYCSIYAMKKCKSHLRKSLGLGCFMAMCSMFIHSFTDFNLQIPANAATFVVVLALSYVAAFGNLQDEGRRRRRLSKD